MNRGRLAGLYLEALERLARQHEGSRRWPEAIRCAERLVAQDPLREESHRLLMQLCYASGDRARAVRAYHVSATTLERELGIEPSAETRAIYESLVAAEPAEAGALEAASASRAPASAARTMAPGMSPFVGHADEQARLAAVWEAAASGRAHLVLVTGEAGVGKTRHSRRVGTRLDGGSRSAGRLRTRAGRRQVLPRRRHRRWPARHRRRPQLAQATVTGIDIWEPALAIAAENIANAGLSDRLSVRRQDVTALDETGRYDCIWFPTFFVTEAVFAAAVPRLARALRRGGWLVLGRMAPPPDPMAEAVSSLRTIRGGGDSFAKRLASALQDAGFAEIRTLPRSGPAPLEYVIGRRDGSPG